MPRGQRKAKPEQIIKPIKPEGAPLWGPGEIVEIKHKEIQAEVIEVLDKKKVKPVYYEDGENREEIKEIESYIYELNEISTLTGRKMGRIHYNAEFELKDIKKVKIRVSSGRPKKDKKKRR